MTEDFDFIYCDKGIADTRTEVESESVAGLGALGEFAGGDKLAVHVQALTAGADRGDDVVPLAVVEGGRCFESLVPLELEALLFLLVQHRHQVFSPPGSSVTRKWSEFSKHRVVFREGQSD